MSEIEDLMEKSKEKFSTAELLFEKGKYEDSVSRAYYSMFHAAKALLLTKGSSPRTHAGIASELGKLFRDELGAKLTSKFGTVQELREDADYGSGSDIDEARTEEVLETAERFHSKAENIISGEK
ncbi:MAG: HEPN domain-containing protein [Candidatus Aenigmatarchaeota archaeon]